MKTSLRCGGCGAASAPLDPAPFRCAGSGGDVDHLLTRHIDLEGFPVDAFFDTEADPFVRFRRFTHAWHTAIEIGMTDEEFVALVRNLQRRIEKVDGRCFTLTPFAYQPKLGLRVKDETSNVSGSHKGRHLMGLMIWLEVAARIDRAMKERPLAIASCGNAALAAAVIARAAGRELDVFIPTNAHPHVVTRLEASGARLIRCARQEGVAGDPTVVRFREAVANGAIPFSCQGNENGLAIEGGHTLGWEMAAQLLAEAATISHLVVQVGGGALASACIAGLQEAHALGLLPRLPHIHTVQTTGAYPLKRAFDRVVKVEDGQSGLSPHETAMQYAVTHRSEFMSPWESAPHSVAEGILDDETYDWAAVVRGMLTTGGTALVASEERLVEANELANTATGIPVDATGSAGLAGVLELRASGVIREKDAVAVLFTGRTRS